MKSSETLWSTRGGGRGGRVCLAVVSGEPGEPGCAVAEKHQTEIEPGGGIDDAEFLKPLFTYPRNCSCRTCT
jgi:hypothetical protein